MVTYNFFQNIFFGSIIRAWSGAEFVALQMCLKALLPYILKWVKILVCQKMGHGPYLMPVTFFCGSLIRAHTGSFGDVPKFFDLLVEVGHMTK